MRYSLMIFTTLIAFVQLACSVVVPACCTDCGSSAEQLSIKSTSTDSNSKIQVHYGDTVENSYIVYSFIVSGAVRLSNLMALFFRSRSVMTSTRRVPLSG